MDFPRKTSFFEKEPILIIKSLVVIVLKLYQIVYKIGAKG